MTFGAHYEAIAEAITAPSHLFTRAEVLATPSPIPAISGLYGWYFRDILGAVDVAGCTKSLDCALLYVGISPSAPPRSG